MDNYTRHCAVSNAQKNKLTILPNGECVPYAVFNGGCNDNIVALAASGGGKTRTLVEPNILAGASSMIISDPKGYLYKKYANILKNEGFDIKHLNTRDPANSDKYNPMIYFRSYDGIQKLANIIAYLMNNRQGIRCGTNSLRYSYLPLWHTCTRADATHRILFTE